MLSRRLRRGHIKGVQINKYSLQNTSVQLDVHPTILGYEERKSDEEVNDHKFNLPASDGAIGRDARRVRREQLDASDSGRFRQWAEPLGRRRCWYSSETAYNATLQAAAQLGLEVNATYWGGFGWAVNWIGDSGFAYNGTSNEFWGFFDIELDE